MRCLCVPQAPLCLLIVGLALYLFRGIYGEAITSYPMNGGSYNLLINTTSKSVAALGACLSIIAYIATGVVRALATHITYHLPLPPPPLDLPLPCTNPHRCRP